MLVPPESPVDHLRNALALLNGAEGRFGELGLIPPDEELIALLRAAKARVWRAVHALEAPASRPPWWFRVRRLARQLTKEVPMRSLGSLAFTLVLLALAACKGASPTAPVQPPPAVGHDPSVQLVLKGAPLPVTVIWATDFGIYDTVKVRADTCIKWTQLADSVYFTVRNTADSVRTGGWTSFTSPWLHVSDYAPFYVDTLEGPLDYQQHTWRTATAC